MFLQKAPLSNPPKFIVNFIQNNSNEISTSQIHLLAISASFFYDNIIYHIKYKTLLSIYLNVKFASPIWTMWSTLKGLIILLSSSVISARLQNCIEGLVIFLRRQDMLWNIQIYLFQIKKTTLSALRGECVKDSKYLKIHWISII